MKLLIRNTVVIDPASPYHGKSVDVFIEGDKITGIGTGLKHKADREFEVPGCHLSPGWVDLGAQPMDPGYEHREDLQSLARAAAAGGFTTLAVFPNTLPPVQGKAEIAYLLNQTRDSLVRFLPIGALSEHCDGKQIAELMDMFYAGAVAFSDGQHPVQNSGLLLRALQYVRAFDGLVINRPHDAGLSPEGQIHEGVVSASLGLRGIPNLAEELMVQRDLYLNEYAGSRLHLYGLSSAHSVQLVREARARNLRVSASVPVLNLAYDDRALTDFDPLFKVLPPLRSKSDQDGLKQGLKDGTIELIVSNHVPVEEEGKKLEFPYADFGALGLETAFGLARKALENTLSIEELIVKMAINPRKLLGIEPVCIREGGRADLSLFLPHEKWTVEPKYLRSKSGNSPLLGETLTGMPIGVVHRGKADFTNH